MIIWLTITNENRSAEFNFITDENELDFSDHDVKFNKRKLIGEAIKQLTIEVQTLPSNEEIEDDANSTSSTNPSS